MLSLVISAASAETSVEGHGQSYWGTIPARNDSVAAHFDNISAPAWQHVVDFPYHIVAIPVRLVFYGIGAGVVALDEAGVISTFQRIFGPRLVPYGAELSLAAGDLTGLGVGVTLVHDELFGPNNRLRFGFATSQTGHHKAYVGARFNVEQPSTYEFGAGYRMTPNARYFGVGPSSKTEDNPESFFRQETSWFGFTYIAHLLDNFSSEADIRYTQIQARGPRDQDMPRIDEAYPSPNGFGDRSDGLTVGTGFTYDSTEESGRPASGSIGRVNVAYYVSSGTIETNDSDFWMYRTEGQHFVPLWFSNTLALRGFYSWIDPIQNRGTDNIVFQRLMTNDDPDLLRGFRDFRWRDRGMLAFSAEYRWLSWASRTEKGTGLDAYLLSDIGQVFGNRREITAENMTVSVGGGFRFISWRGFAGSVEYAVSDEGYQFRLKANQIFQYQKGGLFYGRNPVPAR